ncbi:MAG: hypothetical protein OEZ22_14720 [Spirochaetia bacterium]|nr:hypothetical protein [Spirochaetia bacterium]
MKNVETNGIMNYDFELIDHALLNTEEIKDKHISHPKEAVPPQGSPFLSQVTTIKTIEKNHHKKLS